MLVVNTASKGDRKKSHTTTLDSSRTIKHISVAQEDPKPQAARQEEAAHYVCPLPTSFLWPLVVCQLEE